MTDFKIRFISDGNFGSGVVEFFEGGSMWSHVEIIMPDGRYLGARRNGGVLIRPCDYMKTIGREKRYAIPVSDDSYSAIMEFAQAQIGKPYDMKDIFGIALHQNWFNPDKWICSEYVTACAMKGNVNFLNVEEGFTYKITPEVLHLSPILIGHCYYSFSKK